MIPARRLCLSAAGGTLKHLLRWHRPAMAMTRSRGRRREPHGGRCPGEQLGVNGQTLLQDRDRPVLNEHRDAGSGWIRRLFVLPAGGLPPLQSPLRLLPEDLLRRVRQRGCHLMNHIGSSLDEVEWQRQQLVLNFTGGIP